MINQSINPISYISLENLNEYIQIPFGLFVLLILNFECSLYILETQFSSVHLLTHVQLFATPWTAACQASLSITNSQSLLKHMAIGQ